ncbi:Sugar transporter SWEET [Caenorhabditis elegans]|uniref:Sugar transporter SWEET n=1 Tax=Caenorhabditis elegans TaxID=6239 RepID=P92011_CAEEL|nr:Sugar transporter SWEET [Caenorhabditis elegans]CAB03252.2 Sugar transporter SWEET [Caenorhabditis elegans]|eukprot:NP_506464.2 Sugar transporter SWEET [Caenorhabditis elegans]
MFLEIFRVWIGFFSISFIFLPIYLVLDWKKRGTSDGFSAVVLIIPGIIQSFWLRHGWMTNEWTHIIINTVNLTALSFYISAYAYYQSNRKNLIGQLISAVIIVKCAFFYVDSHDAEHTNSAMGTVAAGAQILGLGGRVYEMRRAVKLGTTEYIPAFMQFAVSALMAQWLLFGIVTGNQFIANANVAGLTASAITLYLYFKYPPLTWTVPLFNIPPQNAKKE